MLWAAQTLKEEAGGRNAAVRVIPGGVRYASPTVVLDLFRDRIELREAIPLSADQRVRLLPAIRNAIRNLGFQLTGEDGLRDLPSPGTAIAAHPAWLQAQLPAPVPEGEGAEDMAADVLDPLPEADEDAPGEDGSANIQEDEGPELSM